MKHVAIALFAVLFSQFSVAQEDPALYQDNEVKVSFRKINDRYGYLLEEYANMLGGVLVEYQITDSAFRLTELDTSFIMDAIVFYDNRNYTEDSTMLSLRCRNYMFPDNHVYYKHLKYIVDDTLVYDGTKMYTDDLLHRALIPLSDKPFKLTVEAGQHRIGPFMIDPGKDVAMKIICATPAYFDEFDYGKCLPDTLVVEGRSLKLQHNFTPWKK